MPRRSMRPSRPPRRPAPSGARRLRERVARVRLRPAVAIAACARSSALLARGRARSSSSSSSLIVDAVDLDRCRSSAYSRLAAGRVRSSRSATSTPHHDSSHADAAHPRRPGGRPRLQGRPVQHRRHGPVPHGRARRRGGRRAWPTQPPSIAIPVAFMAGALPAPPAGFIPGALKAFTGRPRGRHDDHAQLHRRRHPRLPRHRTAARPRALVRPDRRRRQRGAADLPRPRPATSASSSRCHGRPGRLVAPVPDDARLRDPDRRREPDAARYAGMRPAPDHRPDDDAVRACWPGWPAPIEILGVSHS